MKRTLNVDTINCPGEKVKICGWVNSVRSHGKIFFIDLRDRSGIIQTVFTPDNKETYGIVKNVRPEWVISIEGTIINRPKGMVNPNIETGKVELQAENIEVFSEAETIPFAIDTSGYELSEEKRLKYRYIDLRRSRLIKNLETRQKVLQCSRDFLQKQGFLEIETPLLTKSTPEGARDFLVPSRLHPGEFYALPQSPQQYKQLLMVAGVEKYFQIVRCLRDEDQRGDRQTEFTQLDIEMSFVQQEDVLQLVEKLFIEIIEKILPEKRIVFKPFKRITYDEAMKKYKTDKPDLRKNKDNPDELAFLWVIDFPMFEYKKGDKRWGAVHHPFTAINPKDLGKLNSGKMGEVKALQYDLVLNGNEIAGGSIRNHDPKLLSKIFELLGHSKEEVQSRFKHILEAFKYGVPPHGGIASGIDRFLAILAREQNIREVMAFPKTGDGRDLMIGAPSGGIDEKQLKELHIKIIKQK